MTKIITENIDLWTSSIKAVNSVGRGSSKKRELYGIKKLRELIIELAVLGILVPQDPKENSSQSDFASLLEARENSTLKRTKIDKDTKCKSPELPSSWLAVSLGELTSIRTGYAFKSKDYATEGTFILRVTNINPDGTFDKSNSVFLPNEQLDSKMKGFELVNDELLVVMVGGSLGKIGIVTTEILPALLNQNMWRILPYSEKMNTQFLKLILHDLNNNRLQITASTHGHLAMGTYAASIVAFPPLAEQHRIVAKVDALMALCDQLEQQTEDQIDTHETLVKILLDSLTSTTDAAQSQQAWQQIEANFDLLFTTPSSIDHLKQTILQLAVMGKLAPQDPTDEPSVNFPEWLQHKLKNHPENMPIKWLAIPLGKLGIWCGGGTPSKANSDFWGGPIPWVCPKDMKRPIIHNSIHQITQNAIEGSSAKLIPGGSLLMVVRGMILAHSFPIAKSGCEVTINQDMKSLFLTYPEATDYIQLTLNALKPFFLNAVERSSHGTCKLLTKDLHSMAIPIPPLAEQHRIVTKVNALMTLCDTLKANLQASQTTQLTITDSISKTTLS